VRKPDIVEYHAQLLLLLLFGLCVHENYCALNSGRLSIITTLRGAGTMAWYSILPSHLTTYETWIVRAFLGLAILNLAPWLLAIVYDLLYYISRQIWHEIPFIGGRARGAQRPRAPSLRDRARRMSLKELLGAGGGVEGAQRRKSAGGSVGEKGHRRDISRESIAEEDEKEEGYEGDEK